MRVINGLVVPTETAELVDPRVTALVLTDMQNDFCSVGGSAGLNGGDLSMYEEMIPRLVQLLDVARRARVLVVHLRMLSLPSGRSDSVAWTRMRLRGTRNVDDTFEPWSFTVEGSWGAEFISELQPKPGEAVITKLRSSGFHNTALDTVLRASNIQNLVVAGCTTEGCVESTVRDASFHDYIPVVVADCVGSDVRELHDASLLVMSAYRADILSAEQIVEIWTAE